jgi:hypothetical protein
MPSFTAPNQKQRGCFNCDHFQTWGMTEPLGENAQGECRAHPPGKCCPTLLPTSNNWPQIDQSLASVNGWWCDEWKRTTGTPAPYVPIPIP